MATRSLLQALAEDRQLWVDIVFDCSIANVIVSSYVTYLLIS